MGVSPLGTSPLGQGFASRPGALFSCKAPAMPSCKHPALQSPNLCFNRVPKPGAWGVGRRECDDVPGEGSAGERHCSPLHPVSPQRASRSRAWCLRGGSSSSAPCSPSTRAGTLAWHGARALRHARTSRCWCEVGLPGAAGVPSHRSLPPPLLAQLLSPLLGAVAPRIASAGVPSEHSVLEGGGVRLECQAEGQPTPQISWLKDGQPLGLQPPSRAR